MKVLFIGLGSIAKRHIKNLKEILGSDVSITVLRSGFGFTTDYEAVSFIEKICYDSIELESSYDAVFITNPTSLHYDALIKYHTLSNYFFIEKPVFLTGEEDLAPFYKNQAVYYVACPLRCCNVIQYLKSHIDFSDVYSIRCISSSYMPQWRQGIDYRNTYSAYKDMGGGVSIDLVHEWDYIQYLVGVPKYVSSIIRKKSELEIDADDIAVYIAEYSDKVAELHLDYFGRKAIRRMELFTRYDTVAADFIQQQIVWMNAGRRIDLFQERDEYQKKELRHFLDIVNKKCSCDNTLEQACRTLRLARGSL